MTLQQERYPALDPDGLPLSVLRRADGTPVQVTLAVPGDRSLHARVWQAAVGRVTLLLLDTDIPANDDDLRQVTDRLYGGGGEHRLQQELLLGVGGVRALRAWSRLTGAPHPEVFPSHKGHTRFLGVERSRPYMSGSKPPLEHPDKAGLGFFRGLVRKKMRQQSPVDQIKNRKMKLIHDPIS